MDLVTVVFGREVQKPTWLWLLMAIWTEGGALYCETAREPGSEPMWPSARSESWDSPAQ